VLNATGRAASVPRKIKEKKSQWRRAREGSKSVYQTSKLKLGEQREKLNETGKGGKHTLGGRGGKDGKRGEPGV